MKRNLLLSSALTITTALATDEDAIALQRRINKGGKPTAGLPFAKNNQLLPHQKTRDLRNRGRANNKADKQASDESDGNDEDDKMHHDDHDNHDNHDDDDHDMNHDGKSGKMQKGGKGGGMGPDSKSGKSSKEDYTSYYMSPFHCANKCIDADGVDFRTGELNRAVTSCNTHPMHGNTQKWILHQENDFIQVESYAYKGECISVNYMPGDSGKTVHDKCKEGTLAMLPCHDPASKWYFTGGELLSFFCWQKGISSKMSTAYNTNKDRCYDELWSYDAKSKPPREVIKIATSFMFIDSEDMYMVYDPEVPPLEEPTIFPSYFPTLSPTMSPTMSPTVEPTTDDAATDDAATDDIFAP